MVSKPTWSDLLSKNSGYILRFVYLHLDLDGIQIYSVDLHTIWGAMQEYHCRSLRTLPSIHMSRFYTAVIYCEIVQQSVTGFRTQLVTEFNWLFPFCVNVIIDCSLVNIERFSFTSSVSVTVMFLCQYNIWHKTQNTSLITANMQWLQNGRLRFVIKSLSSSCERGTATTSTHLRRRRSGDAIQCNLQPPWLKT